MSCSTPSGSGPPDAVFHQALNAWFVDDLVVHPNTGALPKGEPVDQLVEDVIGAVQPSWRVLDPGGRIEMSAAGFGEGVVDLGCQPAEERTLMEHMFDCARSAGIVNLVSRSGWVGQGSG